MDIITSKDNNKIKYIRNFNMKKYRDQENAFTVEGIKLVGEAINEGANIRLLILSEEVLNRGDVKDIINSFPKEKLLLVSAQVFSSLADTVSSQGLIGLIDKNTPKNTDIIDRYNFIIMCDRIQDPGNLGTILRVADAFGPAALILNKGCVDIYNPKVVRASAGAIFRIPLVHTEKDLDLINIMKEKGFYVVSTVVNSEYTFADMEERKKICIIIGNEGQGISQEIIDNSDIGVTIKMTGRSESLNASVAAGISVYEIRKKLLK